MHFACVLKLFTKHLCKVLKLLFYLARQKVLEDENSKLSYPFFDLGTIMKN